ncbi:helix-turn-helix transcriptional regulator [Roseateles sp. DAIF2]|uniref:helix-turn-helix domain-containing protein n=1 Tax=Roseateles sp. DAIF2 TaxID=2714952 RepID=UPI0018A311DE|nr:helix-turn-helix transcriptional regulator [Roseateles sp. DAIF2]QPF71586.1 helix-turn-helix transcriptional regulator [Roseateles sp. DAIF2]
MNNAATSAASSPNIASPLAALRAQRRISQLELSLRVGVSQRHLSCIETGRSRASREMLIAVLDALEAPLDERNKVLLAAGYAPAYRETSLDDPEMAPVRAALTHLLEAHDPAPALVIDGAWNLLMANKGLRGLMRLLGVDPALLEHDFNLLRACLQPGGLRHLCANEDEVCAALWQRASSEAQHVPALRPLLEELRPHVPRLIAPAPVTPLMHTRLRSSAGELALFSAFTTFGTPLDVTVASLRVEHFFPADAATRAALMRAASD